MALTGIIGAMDLEMESLIGKLEEEERCTVSGMTFHRGKLFGRDTVLAVSGIGKCFAALCAQTMILNIIRQDPEYRRRRLAFGGNFPRRGGSGDRRRAV